MTIYSAYDQMADLLAELAPAKVAAMQASGEMQVRFDELAEKSANGELTRHEKDELDYSLWQRLRTDQQPTLHPDALVHA